MDLIYVVVIRFDGDVVSYVKAFPTVEQAVEFIENRNKPIYGYYQIEEVEFVGAIK